MKTLDFKTTIDADPQLVYSTMIDSVQCLEWIHVFSPNSYFKGGWNKGEILTFCSKDEDDKEQGMICRIEKNIPGKELFVQPIGLLQNGKQIMSGESINDLHESYDHYLFEANEDQCILTIRVSVFDELEGYFRETWPKAMAKIKSMSESNKNR